jgi:hypothetical protein
MTVMATKRVKEADPNMILKPGTFRGIDSDIGELLERLKHSLDYIGACRDSLEGGKEAHSYPKLPIKKIAEDLENGLESAYEYLNLIRLELDGDETEEELIFEDIFTS